MRPLAAALVLALAAPALAQDRPPLHPSRDVAITYRFIGDAAQGQMPEMQVSWLAAQRLMRAEMPGMGWMVMDHANQRAFMVMEQARVVMDVPLAQLAQQHGPPPDASFRRDGTATVAGLACTLWSYRDSRIEGRTCVTADGVMLRVEGTSQGQRGGMEATQVAYGPQDPARFQRPPGYQSPPGAPPPGQRR